MRLPEVNNEPCLLMEEFYPTFIDSLFKEALLQFAFLRAEALGLPILVAKDSFLQTKEEVPKESVWVESLEGPAPIEYFDSLHGRVLQGKRTIEAKFLYLPPRVCSSLSG